LQHCVGICARQRSYFLLLAQEKVSKEKGTPNPAAPTGLLCAARSSREVQKLALRAQTSELLDPSCPALLDASHGDPKSRHQQRARLAAPNFAAMHAPSTMAMRSEPWCIGFWAPLRRAEQRSGRRKEKFRCLSPQGEFLNFPPRASSARQPRRGLGTGVAFLLVTFLWRSKEKLLRCRAHIPTQCNASRSRTKSRQWPPWPSGQNPTPPGGLAPRP
jgi:hypothetical protein